MRPGCRPGHDPAQVTTGSRHRCQTVSDAKNAQIARMCAHHDRCRLPPPPPRSDFTRAVISGNLRDVAKLGGPRSVQLAVARPAYFSLSPKRRACIGSGMVPGIMVMPQNGLFPQRDQALLLPVDMGEWLPEDHRAFVVLDAVATLDLGEFRSPTLVPAPLRPGQARRRCRRQPGRPVRGSRHHAGAAAHRRRDHRRPALARGGPRRMPGPGRCATRCQVPRGRDIRSWMP